MLKKMPIVVEAGLNPKTIAPHGWGHDAGSEANSIYLPPPFHEK